MVLWKRNVLAPNIQAEFVSILILLDGTLEDVIGTAGQID